MSCPSVPLGLSFGAGLGDMEQAAEELATCLVDECVRILEKRRAGPTSVWPITRCSPWPGLVGSWGAGPTRSARLRLDFASPREQVRRCCSGDSTAAALRGPTQGGRATLSRQAAREWPLQTPWGPVNGP